MPALETKNHRRACLFSWSAKRPLTDAEYRQQLAARFWAKVDKATNPQGCWEWTGSRDTHGYGAIVCRLSDGRFMPRSAHIVSYELAGGAIQKGLFVRHTCDNPLCVNPLHLWPGPRRARTCATRKRRDECRLPNESNTSNFAALNLRTR